MRAGIGISELSYASRVRSLSDQIVAAQKGIRILDAIKWETLEDVGTLSDLVDQELVAPPLYLPPPVADLNGLAAWLAYGNFLTRLDLAQVEADYARLLA